jgi:hypothetical protein
MTDLKMTSRSEGEIKMNQTIPTVPEEVTRMVITKKEAAARLSICVTTLDRIDDLPRVNIRGRVFYRPADIETWLEQNAKPRQEQIEVRR